MSDISTDRNPRSAKEILQTRAARLRVPLEERASPDSTLEVICFTLAGERYAFETKVAGEVFPADSWTSLPGTPSCILGVTNFRGEIVPIVDLRPLFGLPSPGPGKAARVILLDDRQSRLGILAETVMGIEILDRADIHPAPATIVNEKGNYIRGMAPGHCVILDETAIRADEALSVRAG